MKLSTRHEKSLEQQLAEVFSHDANAVPALMEEYNMLSDAAKDALDYWVTHAFERTQRAYKSGSYGLKHDFEQEGFYVSDAQFCVAMIKAGYVPTDTSVKDNPHYSSRASGSKPFYGSLEFKVKPAWKYSHVDRAGSLDTWRVRLVVGWHDYLPKLYRIEADGHFNRFIEGK